jgi:hypothetical protein
MDAIIFCNLLAQRINPSKFQIWGTDIHWLVDPTPEELSLADSVVSNYATLAAAYLQEQAQAEQAQAQKAQQKQQDIINNLPSWQEVDDAITAATTIAALKVIIRKMARVLYWLAKNSAT